MNKTILNRATGFLKAGLLPITFCLSFSGPAQAFVNNGLFLNLADEPDIATTGIGVDYVFDAVNAATGFLHADGFSTSIRVNGSDHDFDFPPGFGDFSIEAAIDNSTGDALVGTLEILGEVGSLGFNSGTLLTGSLAGFGSGLDVGNDTLEFLFDNLGGDAATLFGGTVGVIMSQTGAPGGDPAIAFSSSFTNRTLGFPNAGVSNTAPPEGVPEPGTLFLTLTGTLLLLGRRRSRAA